MQRLKAGCFLILSLLLTVPGIALAWCRVSGIEISMRPEIEAWVWGAMLSGASGALICFVMMVRGR